MGSGIRIKHLSDDAIRVIRMSHMNDAELQQLIN